MSDADRCTCGHLKAFHKYSTGLGVCDHGGKCVGGCTGWELAPTVPRAAHSIDDLRVGQVLVRQWEDGSWGMVHPPLQERDLADVFVDGPDTRVVQVVILSDPPPEPVQVPAELIDALAEAVGDSNRPMSAGATVLHVDGVWLERITDAARAVVDAARNGTDQ